MHGSAAGMTLTEIVITAVAFVIVFVAVLVLVLEMSRRRSRREARERRAQRLHTPAATAAYVPGDGSERPGPFGRNDEDEYGGAAGYGRPPGYGPPPLWHDSPYDPRW
jgi:hypothetical protein